MKYVMKLLALILLNKNENTMKKNAYYTAEKFWVVFFYFLSETHSPVFLYYVDNQHLLRNVSATQFEKTLIILIIAVD